MNYESTRGNVKGVCFENAVLAGLASDRGLFVPEHFPTLPKLALTNWRSCSYPELSWNVLRLFIDEEEISNDELKVLVDKSYNAATFRDDEIVPIVKTKDKVYVMELFHGPTFAFKDIALQFLGNLFEFFIERKKDFKMTVIGATSGDTGSSAIYGLRGKRNIEAFILYPDGKVSDIQERQMTSVLDSNIHNLAIQGTFDDCQAAVKDMFADQTFKHKHNLGAVNSINIARILAQIVYYVYAYFRVTVDMKDTNAKVSFSVPTGNFGDVLAGFYAKRLGVPIDDLIVATNENDILHRFFTTGKYEKTTVEHTIAPSMDICVSSNFERYLYALSGGSSNLLARWMAEFEKRGVISIFGKMFDQAQKEMKSYSVHQSEIKQTIHDSWHNNEYLLDPHTAIAYNAALQHIKKKSSPMVVVGTAHAGKFLPTVREAVGTSAKPIQQHAILEKLNSMPTRNTVLKNDVLTIKQHIASTVKAQHHGCCFGITSFVSPNCQTLCILSAITVGAIGCALALRYRR